MTGLTRYLFPLRPVERIDWYPMAFNPVTGLVYLPARQGSYALHARTRVGSRIPPIGTAVRMQPTAGHCWLSTWLFLQ